jgi:serine phosphatase RsbU (regulator of sigma subunit)
VIPPKAKPLVRSIVLAPDLALLYTDGATEARRDGQFFGQDRLLVLLRRKRVSVKRLPQLVVDRVLAFSGGVLRHDLAILALSLSGDGAGDPLGKDRPRHA